MAPLTHASTHSTNNSTTSTLCPRCKSELRASQRVGYVFDRCVSCGMQFFDGPALHTKCGQPFNQHVFKCPSKPVGERILCPLCGAPRHWKDKRLSFLVCSWRQWAIASGHLPADADPTAPLPNDAKPEYMQAYRKWMAAHPGLEAGSVPAERIFRQRMREHQSLQP